MRPQWGILQLPGNRMLSADSDYYITLFDNCKEKFSENYSNT